MLKKALIALMALFVAAGSAAANEKVRIYSTLLSQAETISQKYSAAMLLIDLGNETASPYIADELDELVAIRSNIRKGSETEEYERLTRVLVKALGEWRYTNAASSLWRVVEDSNDPLSRSDALSALGAMRATEYAEKISLILRNLNMTPPTDTEGGEKVAYGAILALERMRSPLGFSPIFFASDGWYSRRIKEQAERSLEILLPDPTEAINALIPTELPDRLNKLLALSLRSQAPAENKALTAGMALERGIAMSPGKDRREMASLATLRTRAMNGLVDVKAKTDGKYAAAYAEAYRIGEVDERLAALRAMGADGTDASAKPLSEIIMRLNEDRLAGHTDNTREQLMRAAIQNAGINKSSELGLVLNLVQNNDKWSNTVISLAKQALKALK